ERVGVLAVADPRVAALEVDDPDQALAAATLLAALHQHVDRLGEALDLHQRAGVGDAALVAGRIERQRLAVVLHRVVGLALTHQSAAAVDQQPAHQRPGLAAVPASYAPARVAVAPLRAAIVAGLQGVPGLLGAANRVAEVHAAGQDRGPAQRDGGADSVMVGDVML